MRLFGINRHIIMRYLSANNLFDVVIELYWLQISLKYFDGVCYVSYLLIV